MYMAVTPDEYELPLAVADSVRQLSEMTGVSINNINSSISKNRSGRNRGMKFLKVNDDEATDKSSFIEQKFDSMLTSHPVKGWYENKVKSK